MLAFKVSAKPDNLQLSDQPANTEDSMTWPMLPGESLNELAAKFYPRNKHMQHQFIFKTQHLTNESLPNLNPNDHFTKPTAIVIPTLQSLSSAIKPIRSVQKKASKRLLRLSYNIKSAVKRLPQSLFRDYENLVVRNEFLKKEIAKVNEKLIFLQTKLSDLKRFFNKTFSLKTKKKIKNLDAKTPINEITVKSTAIVPKTLKKLSEQYLVLSNKLLWLGLLSLSLLSLLGVFLLKKYRERKHFAFVNSVTSQTHTISFGDLKQEALPEKDTKLIDTTLKADTVVEEHHHYAVVEEAKVLVYKNQSEEAIAHLKWAIRAEPKSAINIWLYLLELLRKENLKEEFEKFALEMHQTFNVITPLWEKRDVAIIVPESLEEFPHIVERITQIWPKDSARTYLTELVTDNRNGERTGFGQLVVDEILLLIQVLDIQSGYWEVKGSI
jgi:tetratricopeptide (TPR) repeat protein